MIQIALLEDDVVHAEFVRHVIEEVALNWAEPLKLDIFGKTLDLLVSLKTKTYDCLILDRKLPDLPGDFVLSWLGDNPNAGTSVIMLTSVKSERDAVDFLVKGASEYLSKPVNPMELKIRLARVVELARLKRGKTSSGEVAYHSKPYTLHGVTFDDMERTVLIGDQLVDLPDREYSLAKFFFANVGVNLSRNDILEATRMKPTPSSERTLTLYVHRVRDKLELTVDKGWVIRPIYGFGYRLDYVGNGSNGQ